MPYIKTNKIAGRQRNRPLMDYTGRRFGRLVALRLIKRDAKWNDHKWLFECDCGEERVISIKSVRSGHTSSCGCLFSENLVERNTTHGLSKKHRSEYRSWKDMRMRCNNPNDSDYANYGERGISVCERWNSFSAFYDDLGSCPKGLTLDRIDVNGDYEPLNCQWATRGAQARNKRNNRLITINTETKTLQEWCRHFGVEHSKVRYRLNQGWPVEKAFSLEDFRR
jgi:hypothetical protein